MAIFLIEIWIQCVNTRIFAPLLRVCSVYRVNTAIHSRIWIIWRVCFPSRTNIYGKIYDFPFGKALNGQKPFCDWVAQYILFLQSILPTNQPNGCSTHAHLPKTASIRSRYPQKLLQSPVEFGMCSLPLTSDCFYSAQTLYSRQS